MNGVEGSSAFALRELTSTRKLEYCWNYFNKHIDWKTSIISCSSSWADACPSELRISCESCALINQTFPEKKGPTFTVFDRFYYFHSPHAPYVYNIFLRTRIIDYSKPFYLRSLSRQHNTCFTLKAISWHSVELQLLA